MNGDRIRRATHTRRANDEGSMAMMMMMIVVTSFLSMAMFPLVISHLRTTGADKSQAGSLAAANAGVAAAATQIQSAGVNLASMPCAVTGTLAGGSQPYSAAVTYYQYQLGDDACGSGGPAIQPTYAQIVATGGSGTSSQKVTATYTFNRGNNLTPAGLIHVGDALGNVSAGYCLDGGLTPAVGSTVTLQVCAPISSQLWAYGAAVSGDRTLSLPSTISSTYQYGLCIDAPYLHSTSTALVLKPCGSNTFEQEFSYSAGSSYQTLNTSGFVDGCSLQISGGPKVNGTLILSGSCSPATPTPAPSSAPTATPISTQTPKPSGSPTSTPSPTVAPTSTPSPSPTPTPTPIVTMFLPAVASGTSNVTGAITSIVIN